MPKHVIRYRVLGPSGIRAGGNFVDTACNYTDGESETIVGELLDGRRDRFVVATKYPLTLDRSDPNAGGNHKSLRRAVEQSLRRSGRIT